MSSYSNTDMARIREALARQRGALIGRIRDGLTESEQRQFSAVLGQSPGDSSDAALATSIGDLSAALIDHDVRQLRELDAAQLRIDGDDFGVCSDCGNAIPAARLVANPAAVRCIACQEKYDNTHGGAEHGSL